METPELPLEETESSPETEDHQSNIACDETQRMTDQPNHSYTFHTSFTIKAFHPPRETTIESAETHMPDETTKEWSKAMHYAAYRWNAVRKSKDKAKWQRRYEDYRNRIIAGNIKLTYAVTKGKKLMPDVWEEVCATLQLHMIKIVEGYNPWMNLKFSTYATTCLLRELWSVQQKITKDTSVLRPLPWEEGVLGEGEQYESIDIESERREAELQEIESQVESVIEATKFETSRHAMALLHYHGLDIDGTHLDSGAMTLDKIGRELGISKERVRQLKKEAVENIRLTLG